MGMNERPSGDVVDAEENQNSFHIVVVNFQMLIARESQSQIVEVPSPSGTAPFAAPTDNHAPSSGPPGSQSAYLSPV